MTKPNVEQQAIKRRSSFVIRAWSLIGHSGLVIRHSARLVIRVPRD
jgi:hypothetical protein